MTMICHAAEFSPAPDLLPDAENPIWNRIPEYPMSHYMGERPGHFPKAGFKIAYDNGSLYVMFRVADRYIRSTATEDQGRVWEDSCVEFFFSPGREATHGYFNLEMNCSGKMLLHFQKSPRKDRTVLSMADCSRVERAYVMPETVFPEEKGSVDWTVCYRLPVSLLAPYYPVVFPASGVAWRANFYKCADKSSHPHWLSWAPVNAPMPDFHRPDCFGSLVFS